MFPVGERKATEVDDTLGSGVVVDAVVLGVEGVVEEIVAAVTVVDDGESLLLTIRAMISPTTAAARMPISRPVRNGVIAQQYFAEDGCPSCKVGV